MDRILAFTFVISASLILFYFSYTKWYLSLQNQRLFLALLFTMFLLKICADITGFIDFILRKVLKKARIDK